MTHTPGPWGYAARLSGSENHKGFGLWPATGGAIADIYPMDEDGIEGEANAQLIAAAPELLARWLVTRDGLAGDGVESATHRLPRLRHPGRKGSHRCNQLLCNCTSRQRDPKRGP